MFSDVFLNDESNGLIQIATTPRFEYLVLRQVQKVLSVLMLIFYLWGEIRHFFV